MLIRMEAARTRALWDALRADEDCEENPDGSFTVDLFDTDPPLSMEIYPDKDGYEITALLTLSYSDELEGWYVSDKLKEKADMEAAAAALESRFL
ncbi:MAG: hypothetical protein J5859_07020 [Clostridia bacterium]|nr:hypothetical protein [Clostridia bacterium]